MSIERPTNLAPYFDFKIGMVLKKGVTSSHSPKHPVENGMEILLDDQIRWASIWYTYKIHKSGKMSNPFSKKALNKAINEGDIVGCGIDHENYISHVFVYKVKI